MYAFKRRYHWLIIIVLLVLCSACKDRSLNNPHRPVSATSNISYASFSERPKTLDPARSYSSDEVLFTAQIYEPPYQYHYLKRPYELMPLTTSHVAAEQYFDATGKQISSEEASEKIAYTIYTMEIKKGIQYQPHPAFAKDKQGKYYYHDLSAAQASQYYTIKDFTHTGSRELKASDYVYEIKRLADPKVQSPIYGLMKKHIAGLGDLRKKLSKAYDKLRREKGNHYFLDLRPYSFAGAKLIDDYHYEIKILGKYPQFKYWLAMPFFAPMPWEATVFYSQPVFANHNISLDWFPIGSGPYMLTINNPNRQMVLEKNPNFHGENYPTDGSAQDKAKGLLKYAGTPLPGIDKYIFSLETETIPRWVKFLQGYYDASAISSDSFDQAINIDEQGKASLSQVMKDKNIHLSTSVEASTFYLGFNMLDKVVGGDSQRARNLRHAIAIAVDYNEFISIFMNGRGLPAQGPLPPGIFGYLKGKAGMNPYVFKWVHHRLERIKIAKALALLEQAGYKDGRDVKTGKPLILNFDTVGSAGPDDKSRFEWYRKQFAKINIQLQIRATSYNRFQQKVRNGQAQIMFWGWNADYPDPENFLFLFYSLNGKVKYHGENSVNYSNKEYDRLFEKMKDMPDNEQRQAVITKMVRLLQQDMPVVWALHPLRFVLMQSWVETKKPSSIINNTLKYSHILSSRRDTLQAHWNIPDFWPLGVIVLVILITFIPVFIQYWRKEHKPKDRF